MKILVTLLALVSFSGFAQDAKSQKIVDALSANLKANPDFYIEFNAHVKNEASGLNESNTGKGWVKGEKFHASYGDNTRISNGIKSWTILKEEKSVYVSDADDEDEESINPKKLMTVWEKGFTNKYSKETKLGEETVHVIILTPKSTAKVEYQTITLYVSKSNDLKKVIMKMKDGTVMTYTVTKFEPNKNIPDSKFVFDKSKYPGYKIIED